MTEILVLNKSLKYAITSKSILDFFKTPQSYLNFRQATECPECQSFAGTRCFTESNFFPIAEAID